MGRKWENIKRGKGKLDQERGAVFSRVAKDIMKAAKEGGADPENNIRLKTAIINARLVNMPSENIQRATLKGAGLLEGVRYEDLYYEGYGPGGVAVMLHVVTDNRNRTAAEVRHAFTKSGGALGETGCVGWMFAKRGVAAIDRTKTDIGEDALLEIVLEAGADDLVADDDSFEVISLPESLDSVLRALAAAKIPVERGATTMLPSNMVEISGDNAEKLVKMLDVLDANDDVQDVFTNADFADE